MEIKLRCDDTITLYDSGVHVVIELTAGAGRSVALSSPAQARAIAAELNRLADELEAAICDPKAERERGKP